MESPRGRFALSVLRLSGLILLLLADCSSGPRPAASWAYEGCDPAGTRFFPGTGRRLRHNWQFTKVWEAEDFSALGSDLDALTRSHSFRMFAADLDASPGLELVTSEVILDGHGLPSRFRTPGGSVLAVLSGFPNPRSLHPTGPTHEVVSCSAGAVVFERAGSSRRLALPHPVTDAQLVDIPARSGISGPLLIAVETRRSVRGRDGFPCAVAVITGRDPADGREIWAYSIGASVCRLWACADLDRDTIPELLFGTYGYEHGVSVNEVADFGCAYVLCFRATGELLWKSSFGNYRHLYTRVATADIDGDARPEVITALGSWDRCYGQLFVLDGLTGAVRTRYPPGDPLRQSYTGVVLADADSNGTPEIFAASSGTHARVWRFDFISDQPDSGACLTVRATRDYVAAPDQTGVVIDLAAAADIDGDGRIELLALVGALTQIDDDPYFYPSLFSDNRLVSLDAGLAERAAVSLGAAARAAIIADLTAAGTPGVVVATDRLEYYVPR
jgi:hypothetical protein